MYLWGSTMFFSTFKSKRLLLKILSLFSVIRGYNILILVFAQYLASIYILAPNLPWHQVLFDSKLFVIVVASAVAIAAGYIINNFYDAEKDIINRPAKTFLDNYTSQNTKLSVYFILNFIAVILASYISFQAVLFFSAYIFTLWFYSHKLKKYPFIGNFTASVLTITPFFAIFMYYQNLAPLVWVHALFLYLLIFMRIIAKDLANLSGDFVQNYKTIPVVYGEKTTKIILTCLAVCTLFPAGLLVFHFSVGYMKFYFYASIVLIPVVTVYLWLAKQRKEYIIVHTLLKGIILAGILSIALFEADYLVRKLL